MFIGGDRDHRVKNNLVVDCDPAIRADGRGSTRHPCGAAWWTVSCASQLAAVPVALYRDQYPAIKTLDAFLPTWNVAVDRVYH